LGIELGRTTGKINLTNATGNIELNASADNVELTNSSDNIELNGVAGDIELVIKGGGSSVEIDDTLSITGAAADAAATGYAIGTIKDELDNYDEGAMVSATNLTPDKRINLRVRNKNVFDVSTIHIGYTAESYGNGFKTGIAKRTNTQHSAAHDNVIVKPDTHYVFSLDNTNYWVARIIEVDKDNLCVRNHAYYATKQDNSVKQFITKESTVKLYIAFEKKDGTPATMEEVVALNFQLEVGDTPTPFTPYVDVANREITITGKNIFKPTGGISASDFENKEIGDKMPTEFIEGIYQIHPYTPLKPNTYYTYSTQATRGQGWHGYMAKEIYEADENDIIVAKYSFTPEQPYTKFTFKTTPTTKYMLVNIGGIAFTTGTKLTEKELKIRDFQFEEGNDESGSDFYYEEIYTTDENGCVNGIAFPRDKAHAHIKDKGLVIELEVEEVEVELEELKAAQPDWLEEDTTSHAYIKNKPTYTTIMPSLSCDYKSDFVVGNNLIMEIGKYYTNSFTYDSFYDTTKSIQPVVTYKVANGREYTVSFSAWANGNLYETINGATYNVIINRDDMSEADKAKFPVYGVYVEFGNQANLERTQAVKVEMLRYVKIDKRYLPRDTAYLDDIPEVSAVEVDTTLSKEGVAADAKATGDAIVSLGDNTVGKTYYSIDFQTLKNNGLLVDALNLSSNSLIIAISFSPCIFENGVECKFIDIPFKYMYFNGAILTNGNSFTNVGIQSPVITQQLGIDGVLWIDTIYKIMCNFPDVNDSGNFSFGDVSQTYHPEAVIKIEFNVYGSSTPLNQLKALWNAIFSTPGTKIVFEYQNQENIETYESKYLLEAAPIVNI
jgi:hypothetical protein